MRFNKRKVPELGDVRAVIKFAWWPKVVHDRNCNEMIVWLERYQSNQVWVKVVDHIDEDWLDDEPTYKEKWLENERYVL